jgi:hypothetical protein
MYDEQTYVASITMFFLNGSGTPGASSAGLCALEPVAIHTFCVGISTPVRPG